MKPIQAQAEKPLDDHFAAQSDQQTFAFDTASRPAKAVDAPFSDSTSHGGEFEDHSPPNISHISARLCGRRHAAAG